MTKQRQEFVVKFKDKNGDTHSYTVPSKNPFPTLSYLRTRIMNQLNSWQVIQYFNETYPFTDDCIIRVDKLNCTYNMSDKQFFNESKMNITKNITFYQKED